MSHKEYQCARLLFNSCLVIVILLFACIAVTEQQTSIVSTTTVFVDGVDGQDANDDRCLSVQTPCQSIQFALTHFCNGEATAKEQECWIVLLGNDYYFYDRNSNGDNSSRLEMPIVPKELYRLHLISLSSYYRKHENNTKLEDIHGGEKVVEQNSTIRLHFGNSSYLLYVQKDSKIEELSLIGVKIENVIGLALFQLDPDFAGDNRLTFVLENNIFENWTNSLIVLYDNPFEDISILEVPYWVRINDCHFQNVNTDNLLVLQNLKLELRNTRFVNMSGTHVFLIEDNQDEVGSSEIVFDNITLSDSSISSFLKLVAESQVVVRNSVFENSKETTVFDCFVHVQISIDNTRFDCIKHPLFSTHLEEDKRGSEISIFRTHIANTKGLYLHETIVKMEHCSFYMNSPAINCTKSSSVLKHAIFTRNNPAYYEIRTLSSFINSTFVENSNLKSGAAVYSYESTLEISGSTFTRNHASDGGAIAVYYGAAQIRSSTFETNHAQGSIAKQKKALQAEGGALYIFNAEVSISDSLFEQNSCNTSLNDQSRGGAIFAQDSSISLHGNTSYVRNTAAQGGSMFLYSSYVAEEEAITFFGGSFSYNKALYGGAIAFQGSMNVVYNASVLYFVGNEATYGGAMYYSDMITDSVAVSEFNYTFQDNKADLAGGVIYLNSNDANEHLPTFAKLFSKVGSSNTARGYGPILASKPVSILLKDITFDEGVPFNYTYSHIDQSIQFATFPDNQFIMTVSVSDCFNQTVIGISGMSVSILRSNTSPKVSGDQNVIISPETGVAVFTNTRISGLTGEVMNLTLRSVHVEEYEISLSALMQVCTPGYALQHYNVNGSKPYEKCKPCEMGSYNFGHNMSFCHSCPLNSYCERNSVESMSGYWVSVANDGIAHSYACNNDFCSGGNECQGNRDPKYPVCRACKAGYSNWGNKCLECNKTNVDGLGIFLFVIYLGGLFLFNHVSCQSPASNSASKLLFFFAQTLTLMIPSGQFLQWTKSLFDFNFSALFVGKSKSSPTLKCPFARDGYLILLTNVIEQFSFFALLGFSFLICCVIKILIACIQLKREGANVGAASRPEVILSFDTDESNEDDQSEQNEVESSQNESSRSGALKTKIIHVSIKGYEASKQKLSEMFLRPNAYVLSLIQIMIITYQGITQTAVSFFTCKWYGNSYHAVFSTDIVCYSSKYNKWMGLYIILLLYSFIFPFALIAFMVMNRKKLYHERFASLFGTLYLNYKPNYYWWEGVALLRRTLIIIVFAGVEMILDGQFQQFGIDSVSSKINHVVVGAVLSVLFLIHRFTNPYAKKFDNSLEEVSYASLIMVSWMASVKGLLDTLDVNKLKDAQGKSGTESLERTIGIFTIIISIPLLVFLSIYFVLSNGIVKKLLRKLKSLFLSLWYKLSTVSRSRETSVQAINNSESAIDVTENDSEELLATDYVREFH